MKFYHGDIILDVPESVYFPMEDSLLLAKVLENVNLKGKDVLEIGSGSGLLAIIMAKKGTKVTAVDIDTDAVETAKENAAKNSVSFTCFNSDLFSSVTSKFDLIAFNPPYLPDESKDTTYSGGKTGRETIEKFISEAKNYLKTDGKILLLISSLTGEKEVWDSFREKGFKASIITREKIPWEELMIIEACTNRVL